MCFSDGDVEGWVTGKIDLYWADKIQFTERFTF